MHSANWRERRDPGVQPQSEPSNEPESPDAKYQAMEEGRRVLVANISFQASEKDIQSLFADFLGPRENIMIPHDPKTHQHLGCGFVSFVDRHAVHKAIKKFNGLLFMGRQLKLRRVMKPGKLQIRIAVEPGKLLIGEGLAHFNDELEFKNEMESLLKGFGNIKKVSELTKDLNVEVNHWYYYVDLENGRQADAAIEALDGKEKWNCTIRVKEATMKC